MRFILLLLLSCCLLAEETRVEQLQELPVELRGVWKIVAIAGEGEGTFNWDYPVSRMGRAGAKIFTANNDEVYHYKLITKGTDAAGALEVMVAFTDNVRMWRITKTPREGFFFLAPFCYEGGELVEFPVRQFVFEH